GTPALMIAGLDTGVDDIVAHGSFTCAHKTDNTVWCVGYNGEGELGLGTTTSHSTPMQTLSSVKTVVAGAGHACAIRNDNTLSCWGQNYTGEIGNGTFTNATSPVHVADGVTSVGVGNDHTCATTSTGLQCWGYDAFGELGDHVTDWLMPRGIQL